MVRTSVTLARGAVTPRKKKPTVRDRQGFAVFLNDTGSELMLEPTSEKPA